MESVLSGDNACETAAEAKKRFFVLVSHSLTVEQRRDIRDSFDNAEIIHAPPEVLNCWSDIPPDLERLDDFLLPVIRWMESECRPEDILFIQGEHGATVYCVQRAQSLGLVPVYATSKRVLTEKRLENGRVETTREFCHVRFRFYV
ncbi:CRISPR-associated protein Csx20 [Desulfobotulus alkaliphilus]|nr:CRISPR-associated protein Csx20 [Desulfobotulus alkaliphilus]